jgi:hypothetical protein
MSSSPLARRANPKAKRRANPKAAKRRAKKREEGFSLQFQNDRVPEYQALFDRNLRSHFENKRRQRELYSVGVIDKEGRVINLEKYKSKLFIIDQEFKAAEAREVRRQREEETTRALLRKKRHQALDETRRQEGLQKMKEDRKIRQVILRATRGETSVSPKRRSPKRSGGAAAASPSADSFFLTEM